MSSHVSYRDRAAAARWLMRWPLNFLWIYRQEAFVPKIFTFSVFNRSSVSLKILCWDLQCRWHVLLLINDTRLRLYVPGGWVSSVPVASPLGWEWLSAVLFSGCRGAQKHQWQGTPAGVPPGSQQPWIIDQIWLWAVAGRTFEVYDTESAEHNANA